MNNWRDKHARVQRRRDTADRPFAAPHWKPRKPRTLRSLKGWFSSGKQNRTDVNRRDRHTTKQAIRKEFL